MNADGERVTEDSYSWVHWLDGVVTMRCEDHGGYDGTFLATNFDQGVAQNQKSPLQQPCLNLWIEASTSEVKVTESFHNIGPWEWAGAKFDVWAEESGTDRMIMMELYILREGTNYAWTNEYPRQSGGAGDNVWNFLVALDCYRQNYGKGYEIEWDLNGKHYYAINTLGLLEKAITVLNERVVGGNLPNPPFDINNFKLTKVIFCCESGIAPFPPIGNGGPIVEATLNSLRARYDTADTNGDGKCDMRDIAFVISLFGSKLGDATYDFRGDINTDGLVDMRDISYECAHFGEKY